jgi:HemX protein
MTVAYVAAWLAYVVATARYALGFARSWPGAPSWGARWVVWGAACHLVATAWFALRFGHPPLVGLGPSLATLALLVSLGFLLLRALGASPAVGLLLAPTAAALLGLGLWLGLEPASDAPIYRAPWLAVHVLLSFLGYAGLVVAAAASVMYLLQFRELKRKRFGAVFQFFPDLESLDRISGRALLAGFAALTLGLAVGAAWTLSFDVRPRWNVPQVVWGILTWFVFLAALAARAAAGWMGPRRAWLNLAGFLAVLVAYFVLKWNAPGARFFL